MFRWFDVRRQLGLYQIMFGVLYGMFYMGQYEQGNANYIFIAVFIVLLNLVIGVLNLVLGEGE